MSEQQVLPELDIPDQNHNPGVCDCDLVGGDDSCTIQPPYLSGLERWRMALKQREEELRTALASLAQSEAEGERLQEIHAEEVHTNELLGAEIAEKRAELAREREANQGLREVVKELIESLKSVGGYLLSVQRKNTEEWLTGIEERIGVADDVIAKADALLEPKAKPVATTS